MTASLRERLLRGSLWVVSARAATVLAAFLVNALLARLLTPAELGAYFLALSLVAVAAAVSQLGLTQAVVRVIAEALAQGRPGRAVSAASRALGVVAVASLVLVVVLVAGAGEAAAREVFGSDELKRVAHWAALLVPVLAIRMLVPELFRGMHDLRLASVLGPGADSLILAVILGGILAASADVDLRGVLLLSLAVGAVTVGVSTALLARRLRALAPAGGEAAPLGLLLSISAPLLVTGLAWAAITQLDVIVIGAVLTERDVALYGAAARVALALAIPLQVVEAIVASSITDLWARNRIATLEGLLRAAATVSAVPVVAAVALVSVAGDTILGGVYGPFYRQGATVLLILAAGQAVRSLLGSSSLALMMTGGQRTVMAATVAVAVLTVPALVLATGAFGITGAAAVAAAGLVGPNALMVVAARRRLGIWTYATVSPRRLRAATAGNAGD